MLYRGQGEVIFGLEVMEEAALGHACFGAHILDARCIVSLGPDNFDRRVQKSCLRVMMLHGISYPPVGMKIPTSGYVSSKFVMPRGSAPFATLDGELSNALRRVLARADWNHRISTVGNCGSPLMQCQK